MTAKIKWRDLRVYFFLDPDFIAAPAIIFFPYRPNVLCCGITGMISVKISDEESTEGMIARLVKGIERLRIISDEKETAANGGARRTMVDAFALRNAEHIANLISAAHLQKSLLKPIEQLSEKLEQAREHRAQKAGSLAGGEIEKLNSEIIFLEDTLWALNRDIIANIAPTQELAGDGATPLALKRFAQINFVLNSIDRLEVRGRDSAGVEISFSFDKEIFAEALANLEKRRLVEGFRLRSQPGDAMDRSISVSSPFGDEVSVSFTYKTFSIVGDLGRNVHNLREHIAHDALLHIFISLKANNETIFSHTRWASVGAISEENCHPVCNYILSGTPQSYISVVLNGDIDNYAALRAHLEEKAPLIAAGVSTDTKIISLMIDKFLNEGQSLEEAFRLALCSFEGSHAIAMRSSLEPGKIFLGQRGSGQTIYVGLCENGYVFSSELYGLIEATPRFVRLDGEAPSSARASGQIFILDQDGSGGARGIKAFFYDGEPISLSDNDVREAEITTRDIDRGEYPHFFFKEIMESPNSVANTLLGKYHYIEDENQRGIKFNLDENVLPRKVVDGLNKGAFTDIFVIGHGTAAVAATAVAGALSRYFRNSRIRVSDKIASELSGFHLKRDFSHALVIPITQSGTTTDTNRAVAMARERGAAVISIVNRRQSDITAKSDGVFYTSNGSDIEMSVASTKAFYSQIVAGHILGLALAFGAGEISSTEAMTEIEALERVVPAMREMLSRHQLLENAARLSINGARYWAIVGSGPNKIAADEIRIKLSELCYKTLSTDIIENKKHIDLSAEPLIIVCAAGTPPSVLDDVIKDVAIFKAHNAKVVAFVDEHEARFDGIADAVIPIAGAEYPANIILNTIAGHLWGYYAARHIDEEARFFKGFRISLNALMAKYTEARMNIYEQIGDDALKMLLGDFSKEMQTRLAAGAFIAADNKTFGDLLVLLKYAGGKLPLDDFWGEFNQTNGEVSPLVNLDGALKKMVDSLSRPIDAIRHQAKTVTVGTSRKEAALTGAIFDLVGDLGFSHKDVINRNALAIMRVQPVISSIEGYTLYHVEALGKDSLPQDGTTIKIEKRGGISLQMVSRAEGSWELMGTKKTILRKKEIYIGMGQSDGAPVVIFPLRHAGDYSKEFLLLVHVRFDDSLPWETKRRALGTRYGDIRNLINEYNIAWSDEYLQRFSLARLLGKQAEVIAQEIRKNIEGKR